MGVGRPVHFAVHHAGVLDFARLYEALDASTATSAKIAALVRHFERAEPADAAWAVYFLAGGKPRQIVPTAVLRETACAAAGVDDWLFEACYQAVGDLAETIAHVQSGSPGHFGTYTGVPPSSSTRRLTLCGLPAPTLKT